MIHRISAAVAGLLVVACAPTAPASMPEPSSPSPTLVATDTALATPAPTPTPPPSPSPTPAVLTSAGLRESVTVAGIRVHLEALQGIADANGRNRATGTTGFDASVQYVAAQLAAAGYEVVRQPFTVGEEASVNLFVERSGLVRDAVLMTGAHLDSVLAGPGINDNGSGVATLLVVAQRLAELPAPQRTIRFAFWGAEEGGPFGSAVYVDSLAPAERERIAAYLNFDMLGSPNFIRFVYDEPSAAEGSASITATFAGYFEEAGLAWEPIDLTGHADHGAFTAAGIPTGGLFSGGGAPKTDAQAAAFGGTAGALADPCSDIACDTIANLSDVALDQMSDAVAHAIATLATGP